MSFLELLCDFERNTEKELHDSIKQALKPCQNKVIAVQSCDIKVLKSFSEKGLIFVEIIQHRYIKKMYRPFIEGLYKDLRTGILENLYLNYKNSECAH